MRKKLLLLVLSLAALAGSLTAYADNGGTHSCPICTIYSNGSQCCVPCICDSNNVPLACTDLYCPPEDGGGHD